MTAILNRPRPGRKDLLGHGGGRGRAGALKWVVLALAAFMIYAVWLFPEAKERKDNGG